MIIQVRNEQEFADTLNKVCLENGIPMPGWRTKKMPDRYFIEIDDHFIEHLRSLNPESAKELARIT